MKALIKHYFKNNQKEVLAKSFLNCHIKGLHSIMLSDSPGKMIRLYITDKNHELRENVLSVHSHHCNLTLICMHGLFMNKEYSEVDPDAGSKENSSLLYTFNKFKYVSAIKEGESKFLLLGEQILRYKNIEYVYQGHSLYLEADQLHSVHVNQGEIAAWLVLEGEEDPDYESVCYSTNNLENSIDNTALYVRPTLFEIEMLLQSINVI